MARRVADGQVNQIVGELIRLRGFPRPQEALCDEGLLRDKQSVRTVKRFAVLALSGFVGRGKLDVLDA